MVRLQYVTILFSLTAGAVSPAPCLAEAPSVEVVLKICAENRAKLDPLHVQTTYTEARTEAYAESEAKRIPELEKVLAVLDKGEPMPDLERQLSAIGYSMSQFREQMQQQLESVRLLAKSFESASTYEFFVDGDDCQLRSPVNSRAKNWIFPDTPLTARSLCTSYADTRIYSRSAHRSPPAQIWPGWSKLRDANFPMITTKRAGEAHSMRFPAFVQAMHPQPMLSHPIDVFFSAPKDRYRVVGQETEDGRQLTIVDVLVPSEEKGSRTGSDGKTEEYALAYWYRGWLDLERGGIPVVLQTWYGSEGKPFEEHFRASPLRVTTTTSIERLASGGYYPARTVEEHFNTDPAVPTLSEAEWAEVSSGVRPVPPQVCFERHTWDCNLVESQLNHAADFFVLAFPTGSKLFDLDTGKVVGALDVSPPIAVGQRAPEWNVERWLDGEPRKIDDFRGRVVVIQFWNRDSSVCLAELAALSDVQQKFRDQSLVIVAIHSAESDVAAVAEQIERQANERDWKLLHAIDQGSMYEDSHTRCAYGIEVTPGRVVVGADGKVVANSSIPPAEIADIAGKPCDEVTPEEETRFAGYFRTYCAKTGVSWSADESLSEAQQAKRLKPVSVYYITREIEEALKSVK